MKQSKWTLLLLAVLFFQLNDITMRMLVVNVNFMAGCVIQALPLIILSGILLRRAPEKARIPDKKNWKYFLLYGAVQILFGNVLYFLSMRLGGISIASPTVQSQAVWAVIIGAVVIGEKVTRTAAMGIGLFMAGMAGLTLFKAQGTALGPNWQWGVLMGLLAGLCWASASATQKFLINRGVIPYQVLFFSNILGVLLLGICGLLAGGPEFTEAFSSPDTYKMLFVGTLSSIGVLSLSQSLKIVPLSVAVPVLSVSIIFNTLFGWLFWREHISLGIILSLLVALAGIILSQSTGKKNIKTEAMPLKED